MEFLFEDTVGDYYDKRRKRRQKLVDRLQFRFLVEGV